MVIRSEDVRPPEKWFHLTNLPPDVGVDDFEEHIDEQLPGTYISWQLIKDKQAFLRVNIADSRKVLDLSGFQLQGRTIKISLLTRDEANKIIELSKKVPSNEVICISDDDSTPPSVHISEVIELSDDDDEGNHSEVMLTDEEMEEPRQPQQRQTKEAVPTENSAAVVVIAVETQPSPPSEGVQAEGSNAIATPTATADNDAIEPPPSKRARLEPLPSAQSSLVQPPPLPTQHSPPAQPQFEMSGGTFTTSGRSSRGGVFVASGSSVRVSGVVMQWTKKEVWSTRLQLGWDHPWGVSVGRQELTVMKSSGDEQWEIWEQDLPEDCRECDLPIRVGCKYFVHLKIYDHAKRLAAFISTMEIIPEFNPLELYQPLPADLVFSMRELQALQRMAKGFVGIKVTSFEVLCRSKPVDDRSMPVNDPPQTFRAIMAADPCRRMMHPYLKDRNGHKESPINRHLEGLFFSPKLSSMPPHSPYGNARMSVSVSKMLTPEKHHLYFADFYCNEPHPDRPGDTEDQSKNHYVTLVICKKGSKADHFCHGRLPLLDIHNNPFLKVISSATGPPTYCVASLRWGFWVEVFYTEAISLFEADKIEKIDSLGRGSSHKHGLPNNERCRTCNLRPLGMDNDEMDYTYGDWEDAPL